MFINYYRKGRFVYAADSMDHSPREILYVKYSPASGMGMWLGAGENRVYVTVDVQTATELRDALDRELKKL